MTSSLRLGVAVVDGWNTPFIGTAHVALARNIQDMFRKAIRDLYNRKYMTHVCVTQSSGSGKSRLVDKVAETIFTIPFNVREPAPDADGKLFRNSTRTTTL